MALVTPNHVDVTSADRDRSLLEQPCRGVMVGVAVGEKDGLHLFGLHTLSVQLFQNRGAGCIEAGVDKDRPLRSTE